MKLKWLIACPVINMVQGAHAEMIACFAVFLLLVIKDTWSKNAELYRIVDLVEW